jgi:uncharacterized integral membrane protein (TIGR00697 family)
MNTQPGQQTELKFYNIFTAIFVTVLVLVAPLASKFILIGPFVIAGATLAYPINCIFNDILTEVYGFQRSRRIIWTGMGCQIFAAFMFFIVGLWPAPAFWTNQAAYDVILGTAPRIFLASIIVYFFSEFINSIVLSKMKFWKTGQRGIHQGWRFIASTMVGSIADVILFFGIAFIGVLTITDLITTMITVWVVKVLYEIAVLPISVRLSNYVKKVEGIDVIDGPDQTNYNPFAVFFPKKSLPIKSNN